MSFVLMGALAAKVLKCPTCGGAIDRTEDYRAQFLDIPQIGGPPIREMVREHVTLVCTSCSWRLRTDNWRAFIQVPREE